MALAHSVFKYLAQSCMLESRFPPRTFFFSRVIFPLRAASLRAPFLPRRSQAEARATRQIPRALQGERNPWGHTASSSSSTRAELKLISIATYAVLLFKYRKSAKWPGRPARGKTHIVTIDFVTAFYGVKTDA